MDKWLKDVTLPTGEVIKVAQIPEDPYEEALY